MTMTDYEINKRLAEIAEIDLNEMLSSADNGCIYGYWSRRKIDGEWCEAHVTAEWNPLENWAQIGPLIERFRVELIDEGGEENFWTANIERDDERQGVAPWCAIFEPNPRRAACLAIVAAHDQEPKQ